jgi:hypothetical protein
MPKFFDNLKFLKPFWAAIMMGLVVALSLLWTQKGIHVSGVYSLICAPHASADLATTSDLFCSPNSAPENKTWLPWMVLGIFCGALLSSIWRTRQFSFQIERGSAVHPITRLIAAGFGGLSVGAGAALAGGCTSSLGLTGSAILSVAGFCFLLMFFIGGFVARIYFGKLWHD